MGDTQSLLYPPSTNGYNDMENGKIVLSYENSLLHEADLALLNPGGWINDNIFGFVFEYFENDQFKEISEDICFIAPAVSQFLKLCQGRTREELADCLDDLRLQEKKYIIVAVNDSTSDRSIAGTHWSTMVYSKDQKKIFYFDSFGDYNLEHAENTQKKIGLHLPEFAGAKFCQVACPQQRNLHDCGLYAICFAEEVCNGLLENQKDFYKVDFDADHAFWTRKRIKDTILRLAKDTA